MKEDRSFSRNRTVLRDKLRKKIVLPLFLLQMLCSFTQVSYAQEVQLNLKLENSTLLDALKKIGTATGTEFFYNAGQIGTSDKRITREFRNTPLRSALEYVLNGTPFTFKIEDKTIIITQRPAEPQKTEMKIIELKGIVVDSHTKEPLPGVTVMIEGTTQGTATDVNGQFTFPLGPAEYNIIFSYIGYERLVKKFNGNNVSDFQKITLVPVIEEMDEVVVTGIFTRKKESFTGSSTTFKAEELKAVGASNLVQSLRTLDPSFKIVENNQFGSDPNRMPDIEIRGKSSVMGLKEEYGTDPNQPLFILDGFETTLETIMDLNMNRVASVTLLKDAASTAIYGSKAANGVVVIETKAPEGGRLQFSYKGDFSVTMADLSDYNLMNAREKLQFETLAGVYTDKSNSAINQVRLDSLRNARLKGIEEGIDTYWLSVPLRTGFTHKHNLYAEGGEENIRYGIGLSYGNVQGVMKGSDRQTISGNIDLIYRSGKFQFSNKLTVDYMETNDPSVSFSEYAQANPYYKKYNEDGGIDKYLYYYSGDGYEEKVANPLWNASLNNYDKSDETGFTNNFIIEWFATDDLRARGKFGITKTSSSAEERLSPEHSDFDDEEEMKKGSYTHTASKSTSYEGDIAVTYGRLFGGKHMINAVGGFNFSLSKETSNGYKAIGFTEDAFGSPSFANGYPENGKSSYSESETRAASFYLNGGYAYDNRYLLDFNYRSDGASMFGTNNRFRNTWSVGIGWNLHNEAFFHAKDWFQLLKLRASVGNPGNQNFSAYQAFTTYTFNTDMTNIFGSGLVINALGNKDLAWQETINWNAGADITTWNNRLNITFDWYKKITDPLLALITTPGSMGVKSVAMNAGQQKTTGIEVTLKVSPIYRPQERINWNISLNGTHAKARYAKIGNAFSSLNEEQKASLAGTTRYYDGGSPTAIWAVRSAGIDPATGKELFIKKDGSYSFTYDTDDEVVLGDTEPKLEGVIGTTLYYKGLSVGCYFRYTLGAQIFNESVFEKVENISSDEVYNNQDKRALYNRWSATNREAQYKGISLPQTTDKSSRFVMDENTISGESFNIGYEFTQPFVKRMGLSVLNIQAIMNDLFRCSSVKSERGIDYPFARTVSFSLSATF